MAPLPERAKFLFFVRLRRFGKSLFVDMLRCYYDQNEKKNFKKYFGDLAIGKNPTKGANKYQVLALDFSQVNKGKGLTLEERYEGVTHGAGFYREWFKSFKGLREKLQVTLLRRLQNLAFQW